MESMYTAEIYKLRNPFNENFTFTWDSSNGGPTITFGPLETKLLPKGLAEYGAMKMAHRLVQSKKGGYGATLNKELMTNTIQSLISKAVVEDTIPATPTEIIEEMNKKGEIEEVTPEEKEEEGFQGVNDVESMEDYDEEKERKALLKENNPRAFRAEELDETMSRNELMKYVKTELGVEVRNTVTKDELIQLALDAEAK